MKATYEQPIERNVVITMKESEAKTLRDFIGQPNIEDIRKIIKKYGIHVDDYEILAIIDKLYNVICDLVGDEE
jgi:hypothetical protein